MFFKQLYIPGLAIYTYIIGDEQTGTAAVIDPTRDIDPLLAIARTENLKIQHIIETHVHADFVSGSRELKTALDSSATIHSSGAGGDIWTPPYVDEITADGDEILMGNIRLQAMHTPGHTLEHMSWLVFDKSRSNELPMLLLSGDFVFVGDVGRPDLLGKEAQSILARQLYESVFAKFMSLPDSIEIYPGHGAGSLCGKSLSSRGYSTVGYEKQTNPAMQEKAENRWIGDLLDQMPISPPYFTRMKQVNREGPAVLRGSFFGKQDVSPEELYKEQGNDILIVDVRSKEAFAAAHIPKSISLPAGSLFSVWAGWALSYGRPIYLVLEENDQIDQIVNGLLLIGFDTIKGFLKDGIESWQKQGYPLESFDTMSVQDLHQHISDFQVVDVRTEKEWMEGHIEGARHIFAGTLSDNIEQVPEGKPIAVMCGSGYRASVASSLLKRNGFSEVTNVLGGMSAWKAAAYPITKE